jgi:hypothetical protein
MNTDKIAALTAELAALEAAYDPQTSPSHLSAQIILLRRKLRWHVKRSAQYRRHPNIGSASLCTRGRPRRLPDYDAPAVPLPA